MRTTNQYNLTKYDGLLSLGLAIFSFLSAWYLSGGFYLDLSIPLIYEWDGHFTSAYIKRLIENVWYFSSDANGFPFGSDLYDYPNSDFGNFLILKFLGMVTGNYAYTLNLYYLIGFPVTSVISFFILRKFRLSKIFSLVGAVLFAFLPFHFLRMEMGHLFFTWYFVVPIFVWYGFRIFSDNPLFFNPKKTWSSKIIHGCILFIISSFGIYYAFFGVLIFIMSALVGWRQNRSFKNIFSAVIAIFIVTAGVGANISPTIIYKFQYGHNEEVVQRGLIGAEIYGLKITQLLMPRTGHRSQTLVNISENYKQAPLVNENISASLGVVGSIGFLILISYFFLRKLDEQQDQRLYWFALVTLYCILFATIGGFSSPFSLFISPVIRGWNRISVFIGFISIAALMLVIDQFFRKLPQSHLKLFLSTVLPIVLIIFGLWDQTNSASEDILKKNKKIFLNDQEFVTQIEHSVPVNAAIYQLPYMPFPESRPIHELQDYGLFRAYLHAQHLRWSYGGMKGREGDKFFKNLANKPISEQIKIIKKMQFKGLYIDRRGYHDRGAALEKEITKIIGRPPSIISADGSLSFYVL